MTYNLTINKEKLMKQYLNSLYGSLCYVDTDSIKIKEYEMKKYIIVHKNGNVGIIFKDKIESIFRDEYGKAYVYTNGHFSYLDDKYEDIVKQLI